MLNVTAATRVNNILNLGFPNTFENPSTSNEKLFSFIDDHPEGIVMLNAVLDSDGIVRDFVYAFINHTAENMLQRTKSYLIGKTLLGEFPGTQSEGIFDIYKKVYTIGRNTVLQFHYVHEGFDTSFRQKIEKFEDGILVNTVDISATEQSHRFPDNF